MTKILLQKGATLTPELFHTYRLMRCLTQEQLADMTGIPQSSISGFERKLFPLSEERLRALCKALDLEIENSAEESTEQADTTSDPEIFFGGGTTVRNLIQESLQQPA